MNDLASRVLERCSELARISDEEGCLTRSYLSPAMERAGTLVAGWMQEAGLDTELDGAGNLIGCLPCELEDAPVLVLGSHLDTVRDAGSFDGALGVLLALAAVEGLAGSPLPFHLEILAFADEEGLRFGVPFLGSQALIGQLDAECLGRRDGDGVTMAEAIRSWGGDPGDLPCRYRGRRLLGYLEAHIEQGPYLEHHDLPLGILEAIAGSCWLDVRFRGRAGHAGTTPMELRKDAVPAAAEWVLATERLARDQPRLVATVGKLDVTPGAGNVIAGGVEMSLDVRHPDSQRLRSAMDSLLERGQNIAERRGLCFEYEVLHHQDGVEADPRLSQLLAESVAATGHRAGHLLVGAGHDALILSRLMPMTMLLLRSPGGISHHPDESVLDGDVEAALEVMGAFLRRLADVEGAESPRDWGPRWRLDWPEGVEWPPVAVDVSDVDVSGGEG